MFSMIYLISNLTLLENNCKKNFFCLFRLREILMFCSRFPSTPHITIPVLCGKEKEAEKVCKKLSTVSLNEVR